MFDVIRWVAACLLMVVQLQAGQVSPAELLRGGQYKDALSVIQKALVLRPRDARLLSMQGIALEHLGDEGGALRSYRAALSFSPECLAALEGAVQIEYRNNDQQALTHLNRLVTLNANDQTARAMRAAIETRSRQCSAAVQDFEAASEIVRGQADALRQFGACLFYIKRWRDAEQTYLRLRAIVPDDLHAVYGAAVAEIEDGRFEQAVATLKPFTSDAGALALSATALAKLERIPEAVSDLRNAIGADPTREDLYTQFAELCFTYQSFQAGIDVINAGLTQLPRSSELYVARGVLLVQQGNYELADKDFTRAEELSPNDATSADAAVLALVQADKLDEAKLALSAKLKRHPQDPQLLYFLGDVQSRQGDALNAIASARSAISLRPNYVLAHDLLARLYLEKGESADAEAECRAALKSDPQDEAALYRLIRILKARHSDGDGGTIAALTQRWVQARHAQREEERRASQFRIVSNTQKY